MRAKCGQSGGAHRIAATTVTPNAAVLRPVGLGPSRTCMSASPSFHRLVPSKRRQARVRRRWRWPRKRASAAGVAAPGVALQGAGLAGLLPGGDGDPRGPAPLYPRAVVGRTVPHTHGHVRWVPAFRSGARITWEVGAATATRAEEATGRVGEGLNGESLATDRSVGRSFIQRATT